MPEGFTRIVEKVVKMLAVGLYGERMWVSRPVIMPMDSNKDVSFI